jgi:hypothetical protein
MSTVDLVTPQPGWIGLTRIKGWVGLGIRCGQFFNGDGFTDLEHAFMFVGDDRIVEAEPGGAVLGYLSEYDPAHVVWLPCPPQFGPAVADAARGLLGTPYSFLDYFAIAAHRLHIPAPGLRRYIADTHHLICSQLVDEAARRGGWQIFDDGRWPGFVTPGALNKLRLELLAARPEGAA